MKIPSLDFELLEKLTVTAGVPGREDLVREVIRSSLPLGKNEFSDDRLGNLVAHIPGKGKRVMLVAHMDEVGLIVQRIHPDGFLKVERLGAISLRALPGNRLSLWTNGGCIPAQVVVKPQHLDTKEMFDISSILIDVGASSSAELKSMGIRVGDVLTWDSPLRTFGKDQISGKALDDRLGCYILIQLVKQLKPQDLHCDLYLAFTVQEESMLTGGVIAVRAHSPDIIIGVDGTLAFDSPDLNGMQSDLRLGDGPALKWMDAIRGKMASFVPDHQLAMRVREIAQEEKIPLQDEVITGLSTAVTPMQFSAENASTIALSVPIRYHHTPIETANLSDLENMILLLREILKKEL
jgi:putative aminopeptidase FrvX